MANVTLAQGDSVHGHFANTVEVNERSCDDQDVENLVRLELKLEIN